MSEFMLPPPVFESNDSILRELDLANLSLLIRYDSRVIEPPPTIAMSLPLRSNSTLIRLPRISYKFSSILLIGSELPVFILTLLTACSMGLIFAVFGRCVTALFDGLILLILKGVMFGG